MDAAVEGREQQRGGFGGTDLPKTPQNPLRSEQELLAALAKAGVTLFCDAGTLRARPASALTDELRAAIAAHRPALLARVRDGRGTQNPQNAQNPDQGPTCDAEGGSQNSQPPPNPGTVARDAAWVKERMKGIYGLIKEALDAGYLGPAQQVGADVVEAVEQVAKGDGDVARACRLLSRDGAGNDVAAAALLAAYEQLCRRLGEAGVDPFRRRAAVALMLTRASEGSGDAVVRPDGTVRRSLRERRT